MAAKHTILESAPKDTILVPVELREVTINTSRASTRLQHILGFARFRLLGDLHGRTLSEIGGFRQCGKQTVAELCELLRRTHGVHPPVRSLSHGGRPQPAPTPLMEGRLVPDEVNRLKVAELPISVRLEGVLQRMKVQHLGNLDGVLPNELLSTKNCGKKTLAELQRLIRRAQAGEFSYEPTAPWNPAALVNKLDKLVQDLPPRTKQIYLLRLAATTSKVATLAEIGSKFRLTRERVRQVVELGTKQILRRGGERLRHWLKELEAFCRQGGIAVSSDLVKQWFEIPNGTGQFAPAFYARLIVLLRPSMPVSVVSTNDNSVQLIPVTPTEETQQRHPSINVL